jgi:hypothetical protein
MYRTVLLLKLNTSTTDEQDTDWQFNGVLRDQFSVDSAPYLS